MDWTNSKNKYSANDDSRPPQERYYSVDAFLFGALARIGEAYDYKKCPAIFFEVQSDNSLSAFDSPDGLTRSTHEKVHARLSSTTYKKYCDQKFQDAADMHGNTSREFQQAVFALNEENWEAIRTSVNAGKAKMQLDKFVEQPQLIMLFEDHKPLAHNLVTGECLTAIDESIEEAGHAKIQCTYCEFKQAETGSVTTSSKRAIDITHLVDIIDRDDFDEVDSARDIIKHEELEALVAHYWTLTDWQKKRTMVDMMMDQYIDEMKPMMLDFLRAPDDIAGDQTEMAKAVAIGFSDDKYNISSTYYNDRQRLQRDVESVLKANGLTVVDSVERLGSVPKPSTPFEAPERTQFTKEDAHKKLPSGATLLQLAAKDGRLADARTLLELGADVNATTRTGATPISSAASAGKLEVVKLLFQFGADTHMGLVTLLDGVPDGRKPIHLAAANGHTDVVSFLITEAGNSIDERRGGYTLLMSAAWRNHYELAVELIKLNSNVNAVFENDGSNPEAIGFTPLVFAVNAGLQRMTKLLVDAGADVTYQVPSTPPRYVHQFNKGKRAQEIDEILQSAGANTKI